MQASEMAAAIVAAAERKAARMGPAYIADFPSVADARSTARLARASATDATAAAAAIARKRVAEIPRWVRVHRTDHELAVCWSWSKWYFGLWCATAATICVVGAVGTAKPMEALVACLFAVPFVWGAGAMVLNSTTVVARRGTLSVTHAPVPFLRNREVAVAEVRQLFVASAAYTVNGQERWHVRARLANGKEVMLVRALTDYELALGLEALFEEYLGIVDVTVPGEESKT
jgi:hypothetical protein